MIWIAIAVIVSWLALVWLSRKTDNYVGDPPTAEEIERLKKTG